MRAKKPTTTEGAMGRKRTIRAWRDPLFRATLSKSAREGVAHPSGENPVDDPRLHEVVGGFTFGDGCNTAGCFTACWTNECTQSCSPGTFVGDCYTKGAGNGCMTPLDMCTMGCPAE